MFASSPIQTLRFRMPHRACIPLGMICLALAPALAAPPRQQLPLPYYSFDRTSPSVLQGIVGASDILTLVDETPTTVVAGAALGFFDPDDDLDALSGPNDGILPDDPLLMLFSVDRQTFGIAEQDPMFVDLNIPYNVSAQAFRGQQAGDQFMATGLYDLLPPKPLFALGTGNSILGRNNYNEGGTDFGGEPPTHARDDAGGASQDNVNGTGQLGTGGLRGMVTEVYFTATADSPALFELPGFENPSGATIFFNENPADGTPTTLYASPFDLGLQPEDDIDAMLVFDFNRNGLYDGNDLVVFSLTPMSPALDRIQGASETGAAADIFIVLAGNQPRVFANAIEYGLGDVADNLNALEFTLCFDGGLACLEEFGIRAVPGDFNDDGAVTVDDFYPWGFCLDGPDIPVFDDGCRYLDLQRDGDVDLRDFRRFQLNFEAQDAGL